jgi:GNAT superfamily N-acetyltransferase
MLSLRGCHRDADAAFVDGLNRRRAEDELAAGQLPDELVEQIAGLQATARRAGYERESAQVLLVCLDDDPIGFTCLHVSETAHHLVDLCLQPQARGHGAGTWVLEHLMSNADAAGCDMVLTARSDSSVAGWYRRHGFEPESAIGPDVCLRRKPRVTA